MNLADYLVLYWMPVWPAAGNKVSAGNNTNGLQVSSGADDLIPSFANLAEMTGFPVSL